MPVASVPGPLAGPVPVFVTMPRFFVLPIVARMAGALVAMPVLLVRVAIPVALMSATAIATISILALISLPVPVPVAMPVSVAGVMALR